MGKIKNSDELEFAIFCIENIAIHMNAAPESIYNALSEKSNILNSYIVENYDILHTQSKNYIINDILQVMNEEGVII